jgi:hypothetical protein
MTYQRSIKIIFHTFDVYFLAIWSLVFSDLILSWPDTWQTPPNLCFIVGITMLSLHMPLKMSLLSCYIITIETHLVSDLGMDSFKVYIKDLSL